MLVDISCDIDQDIAHFPLPEDAETNEVSGTSESLLLEPPVANRVWGEII